MQKDSKLLAEYEWKTIDRHGDQTLGDDDEMVIIETERGTEPQKNPREEIECVKVELRKLDGGVEAHAKHCAEPNQSLSDEEIQEFVEEFLSS